MMLWGRGLGTGLEDVNSSAVNSHGLLPCVCRYRKKYMQNVAAWAFIIACTLEKLSEKFLFLSLKWLKKKDLWVTQGKGGGTFSTSHFFGLWGNCGEKKSLFPATGNFDLILKRNFIFPVDCGLVEHNMRICQNKKWNTTSYSLMGFHCRFVLG